jgi:fucose permease
MFNGREKFLLASIFSIMILYAIFASLYGSEATVMMGFFKIGTTEQGFLTTLQSAGGLAISLLLLFFGDKMGRLKMVAFGVALLAAGSLLTALGVEYVQVLLFALVAGVGYTFIDIMSNAAIMDIFPGRKKTALPMMHMTYGIGAVIGPFFTTAIVDPQILSSFGRPFLTVGIAGFAALALFAAASGRIKEEGRPKKHDPAIAQDKGGIFRYPAAWVMLAAGILYFSFQRGLVSWYPSYMIESAGVSFWFSGVALTLFFVGMLVFRISSPYWFNRVGILKMCIMLTALSGVSMLLSLVLVPVSVPAAIVFVILGGALQGVFGPAFIYLICDLFPGRSASASSVLLIALNLGGITAPLWMGRMAESMGFTVPLYIIFSMLVGSAAMIALAHKIHKKREAPVL